MVNNSRPKPEKKPLGEFVAFTATVVGAVVVLSVVGLPILFYLAAWQGVDFKMPSEWSLLIGMIIGGVMKFLYDYDINRKEVETEKKKCPHCDKDLTAKAN